MATSLLLPGSIRLALEAAALAAYPQEFCALLLGRPLADGDGFAVEDWCPAANIHPEPLRHFELDPTTHFATLRKMRARPDGLSIIGHAHSHPDAKAEPSATDLAMAFDEEMVWLILSVTAGAVTALTAWRPKSGAFHPLTMKSIAG
jgi:proteasome lid subunit RPN8/RPN11